MVNKGGAQKTLRILIFIFFVNIFFSFLITPASAAGDEFLGYYNYTFYVDGYPLEGKAQRHSSETSKSISTYFGTYQNVIIVGRSTRKLSHPYKGFIEISDDKAYFDQNYYLRKAESRWKIRLTGYYEEEYTLKYEYGNYVILQDTATVFEITYTMRFYIDRSLQDSSSCREFTTYETQETITVDAGSYKCDRFKTNFYEDAAYMGYSRIWASTEDGTIIKQQQYDDSNNLIILVTLVSEKKPIDAWEIASWVLGALGIVVVAYAISDRRKKRILEPGTKTKGKIKPILYGLPSHAKTSKGSAGEAEKYRSSRTSSGMSEINIHVHREEPQTKFRFNKTPVIEKTGKFYNPNCPLCFGKGEILTSSGYLPCPFCHYFKKI